MPWYEPRGMWIPSPSMGIVKGKWRVQLPEGYLDGVAPNELIFATKAAALDAKGREGTALHAAYKALVSKKLDEAEQGGMVVGAVVLEAVMHGAGGMYMVDPLMQRVIAAEGKARGIPVVLDEVSPVLPADVAFSLSLSRSLALSAFPEPGPVVSLSLSLARLPSLVVVST
jgi:hypothetical protein